MSGSWRVEKRTKKGEEQRVLHFHARDGDGLVYMGALQGGAVPKGSVWQGTKKVCGFEMRAAGAAPPLPAMSTLPPLPPPLAGVPATARYLPGFVTEDDEALLLEHIRRAGRPWASGQGRRVQNWGGVPIWLHSRSRGIAPLRRLMALSGLFSHSAAGGGSGHAAKCL